VCDSGAHQRPVIVRGRAAAGPRFLVASGCRTFGPTDRRVGALAGGAGRKQATTRSWASRPGHHSKLESRGAALFGLLACRDDWSPQRPRLIRRANGRARGGLGDQEQLSIRFASSRRVRKDARWVALAFTASRVRDGRERASAGPRGSRRGPIPIACNELARQGADGRDVSNIALALRYVTRSASSSSSMTPTASCRAARRLELAGKGAFWTTHSSVGRRPATCGRRPARNSPIRGRGLQSSCSCARCGGAPFGTSIDSGSDGGTLVIWRDVTTRATPWPSATARSTTDPLTGIPNRRRPWPRAKEVPARGQVTSVRCSHIDHTSKGTTDLGTKRATRCCARSRPPSAKGARALVLVARWGGRSSSRS